MWKGQVRKLDKPSLTDNQTLEETLVNTALDSVRTSLERCHDIAKPFGVAPPQLDVVLTYLYSADLALLELLRDVREE